MSQSLYFLSSLREGTKEAEEKVDTMWSEWTITDMLSFKVFRDAFHRAL